MQATTQLRNSLERDGSRVAPGVFDGLSAKLVGRAGFAACYASGGAIARSTGFPDLGLLSFTEVCDRLAQIVDAVEVPVVADADPGFGNSLNVYRTVRSFENLGVAALHLEDQSFPKRCGHLDDKSLVSTQEMVRKIKVARDSLRDADFVLIARTDAIAVEGFEAALARAHAYAEAGADMLFVEGPESVEQFEAIARSLSQPKLINMFHGGKTPSVPLPRLAELGYRLVIVPSDLQRAAIRAMQETLAAIGRDGSSHAVSGRLATFAEREEIIETGRFLRLDAP